MSKYIGRLVNLGLARETTRGTAVAPAYWMPKTSVAFFDRVNKYQSQLNYGVIGDANQAYKANEWSEGSIETELNDKSFGLILYALFGSLSSSGVSDSAYTHTFSIANTNQHTSLTLTLQDPDRTDYFALSMLDSLEISIVPDEPVMITANFKGRSGRQQATATASYAAFNKFLGRHASVKIATVVGGLAAASAISIKSLKLTFTKNVIQNNILGTVWPDDLLNQKFEITGEMELDLEDQTYRNLMLDGSYRAFRLQMTNNDVLIGATSRPDFKIDLARVHFESWEPVRANDEIVTQKVNFRALYDITTTSTVNSCTLINNVVSY